MTPTQRQKDAGLVLHLRFLENSESMGDHNLERGEWHGWHHHVTLAMLTCAMMAAVCYRANALKKLSANTQELIRWSIHEIRRRIVKLEGSKNL